MHQKYVFDSTFIEFFDWFMLLFVYSISFFLSGGCSFYTESLVTVPVRETSKCEISWIHRNSWWKVWQKLHSQEPTVNHMTAFSSIGTTGKPFYRSLMHRNSWWSIQQRFIHRNNWWTTWQKFHPQQQLVNHLIESYSHKLLTSLVTIG